MLTRPSLEFLASCSVRQRTGHPMLGEIASTRYELRTGDPQGFVRFTASCGLAEFTGPQTVEQLIRSADEALYDAKKAGKNRVVVKRNRS